MARAGRVALADLEALHPGSFAFVMATGIISIAEHGYGNEAASVALLAVAIAGYLVLAGLFATRMLRFGAALWADTERPQRAFGFFTFVAGSNVLAARLDAGGQYGWALLLAAIGCAAWLVIVYLVPLRVVLARRKPPAGDAVNGAWLIWVVGSQSVVIAVAGLGPRAGLPADVTALCAISVWAFASVLYILLMAVILGRLTLERLDPVQASPPYWITMGATAITVLAGAQLLALPQDAPLVGPTHPAIAGFTFFLWAFGSWWFPFMILLTAWRYVRMERRAYEQTLWSMVFPLGMYSVATGAYARVAAVPLLGLISRDELWLARACWVLVGAWMVVSWFRPAWPSSSEVEPAPTEMREA